MSVKPPEQDAPSPTDGEPDGLLEAYAAKRADLIRFFTARMNSAVDAEDLIQDLYLKLAAMAPGQAVDSPSAFLYRMAVNLMLDRARGTSRTIARDDAWHQTRRIVVGGADAADEASPEQATASRERLRRLVEAVGALPAQTRRAFELHKLEGLSHAETAQRMGVSRKTVEKQVSSALRMLIVKLGQTD